MVPENLGFRMHALIRGWADFVIANRLAVLISVALFLVIALFTGPTTPYDNSTERYFVDGDPTIQDYDRLLDLFGDNEYLVIGFEAADEQADVLTPDTLRDMVLLTDYLESHPYITQVRSLTNFQYIHADGDNLSTDYLIDEPDTLAQDPTAIASAKAILQGEPLAMGTLITADFRHARIAARVEYHPGTSSHKTELVQGLYRYIEAEIPGSDQYTLHVSGYPVAYERFETLADEDLDLLIPIMILLMVIMLYLNFRSLVGTVFPWVVIAGGVLLVGEIQSYLQLPHSTVDSALLPTLIIIGIGITVHVLVEYFHQRRLGLESKAASHTAILHIWRPALFASITTSAGFYALSITKILPVRDFALLGAIGPLALFLFAVTVLPAMLSYVKVLPPRHGCHARHRSHCPPHRQRAGVHTPASQFDSGVWRFGTDFFARVHSDDQGRHQLRRYLQGQ
jgi:predicted RND superfamily exporter protein